MSGLLDLSPGQAGLLNAGLGMMSAPSGSTTGQAIGYGGQDGLRALMLAKENQRRNESETLKIQKLQQEQAREAQKAGVISNLTGNESRQELAQIYGKLGMFDQALKLSQPEAKNRYSQTQLIPTASGLLRVPLDTGNATEVMHNGQSIIRATDDPYNKGRIKSAQEGAKIFNPKMSDGSTQYMTGGQLTGGGQQGTWEGSNNPNLDGEILDAENAELSKRAFLQYQQQEQSQSLLNTENKPPLSVGQSTRAEAQVKADVALKKDRDQSQQERTRTFGRLKKMLETTEDGETVENLILKSTGSGIGTLKDDVYGYFGASTKGAEYGDKLKTLEGWLISNVPRMEGPQSEKDVELYKQMAARIADTSIPAERRLSALKTLKSLVNSQVDQPATFDKIESQEEIDDARILELEALINGAGQ